MNSIKFLFTHSKDKRFNRRVKAAQLIEKDANPDVKKCLLLLYSSPANLLSFSNYYKNRSGRNKRVRKQEAIQLLQCRIATLESHKKLLD